MWLQSPPTHYKKQSDQIITTIRGVIGQLCLLLNQEPPPTRFLDVIDDISEHHSIWKSMDNLFQPIRSSNLILRFNNLLTLPAMWLHPLELILFFFLKMLNCSWLIKLTDLWISGISRKLQSGEHGKESANEWQISAWRMVTQFLHPMDKVGETSRNCEKKKKLWLWWRGMRGGLLRCLSITVYDLAMTQVGFVILFNFSIWSIFIFIFDWCNL